MFGLFSSRKLLTQSDEWDAGAECDRISAVGAANDSSLRPA